MSNSFWQRAARLLYCGTVLVSTLHAFALQPPTREQLEKMKKDGSLPQRAADARRFGNHLVNPALAARAHQKLQREYQKATGAPVNGAGVEISNAPPGHPGLPSSGTPKVLVILVDFPDYAHTADQTQPDVQSKFFADGDLTQLPYESLRNFYQRSSYGKLTITGNVLGWYRAQNSRSYYENLGMGPGEEALMMEAMDYYAAQGHDFTQYDNDNDGTLDSLFLKWTGDAGPWASFWWAYEWVWHSNPGYRVSGKAIGNYVWSWIANPPTGVFQAHTDIHETGHLLGLPDLYDYDSSVGPRGGVGGLDMMDSNWGDHNCFSKFLLDWLTPTTVTSGSQSLTLNPSGTSQDCVLIMPGVTSGNAFGEFFMAQYRKRSTGNDPPGYPTDGFTIWHIDSTLSGGGFLYDNSYTAHKLVRLMEADGLEQIEQGYGANAGDFYLPPKAFGPSTVPNSQAYNGVMTGVQVDELTSADATMGGRFSVDLRPYIVASDSTITSESCQPLNNQLDPQEQVTLSVGLRNMGSMGTTNLVATLQTTGGVLSPSSPQIYGALGSGAPAVSRPFTFVVGGGCGDTLTATFQLQDGAASLGTVSFTFQIGGRTGVFAEGFDSVVVPALPVGWTATVASGTVDPWASTAASSDTAPNSVFSPDVSSISDNWLDTPEIAITTSQAQLMFRHNYDLESGQAGYDGGVLEIAIGAGAFTDIIDAGGSFVAGGYNQVISTAYGNPIGGRQAWSGTSNGFITTTVDLPATAAGQTVRLRWRLGSDSSASNTGWYVDSILITDGFGCCVSSIGDFDGDGDVDQEDFGRFQDCFTGRSVPQDDPACLPAKMDADSDVDTDDLAIFMRCMTAANVPADPSCRNPP